MDRTVRYLTALGGASTSRVLNLAAMAETRSGDPEYHSAPFFVSPVLNTAILLKHRVRSHEDPLFREKVNVAIKTIVPFDRRDLRLGGRAIFAEQKGFAETLKEIGQYREGAGFERDLEILRILGQLLSLDPFLLRECLKMNQFDVANCYFEISPGDQSRMYEFAAQDMLAFVRLATGEEAGAADPATMRLVAALLANEVTDRLDPLRATLMLNGKEFREGVFSWRGFLYYKWALSSSWPHANKVLAELQEVRPNYGTSADELAQMAVGKKRIADSVHRAAAEIRKLLQVYDESYAELIQHGQPKAFRDFLLGAPHMFIDLGEKMGAISHILTFWRYRFPNGVDKRVDADELWAIFQDFEAGFAPPPQRSLALAG